jgi:hypothetical protein
MDIIIDLTKFQEEAVRRHQEVLSMIEGLSDIASSDRASAVWWSKFFLPRFTNIVPDQWGILSIINQVCSSSIPATEF